MSGFRHDDQELAKNIQRLIQPAAPAPQAGGTDAEIARYTAMICVRCEKRIEQGETCIWDASVWRHVKCAAPELQVEAEKLWCTNCCTILTDKDNYMDDMYLCQNCGSACKRVGAAPAETAQSLTQGLSAGANDAIRHENAGSLPANSQGQTLMPATSSAGEMTAEQFYNRDSKFWDNHAKGGKYKTDWDLKFEFAEAFAKQRVEQVERQYQLMCDIAGHRQGEWDKAEAKVADLERERDRLQALVDGKV